MVVLRMRRRRRHDRDSDAVLRFRLPMTAGWGGPCHCAAISECGGGIVVEVELLRLTEEEKWRQIGSVAGYQQGRNRYAADVLASLPKTARDPQNAFASLMEAVKTHSLGQISRAFCDVGGEYRRDM